MYDAISLDTSVLRAAAYKFDSGLLDNLKQFNGGAVQFLLSEIVVREAYKHVLEDEKDRKRDLQNFAKRLQGIDAYKELREKLDEEAASLDPSEIASERINKFIRESGALVLLAKSATIEDITLSYFGGQPPFDHNGKKSEFPDAIALFGLNNWAKENQKHLLVATKDGDWQRFCDGNDRIDALGDLADVLACVQDNAEEASKIACAFIDFIRTEEGEDDLSALWDEIEYATSSMDVVAEAHSALHIDADYIEVEVNEIDLADSINSENISIVRFGSSEIAFSMTLNMSINATAFFDLSVWDSVDSDYVGMGSTSARMDDFEFEAEYLVTLTGEMSEGPANLVVRNVDIIEHPNEIDFGEIEIDHLDDHWDPNEDLQLEIFAEDAAAAEKTAEPSNENESAT